MRWAARVRQGKIRRLYNLNKLGIYPDLLDEVGWGLYARALDVLTVHQAVLGGEVPCPQCGGMVYRRKYHERQQRTAGQGLRLFSCPHCGRRLTWRACRDALRQLPRCFDCLQPLQWTYAENQLACRRCGKEWSWQKYRRSLSGRLWLPCRHCNKKIRRPERSAQHTRPRSASEVSEEVTCPRCGSRAVHAGGKVSCAACGYEKAWQKYRERIKRRVERLHCSSCGHEFTWQAWREHYRGQYLLSGNPMALRKFIAEWAGCESPQERMIEVDNLLHALHARGALGPFLIEGDEASVMALLDDLAQQP